jgi:Histidine kinase-, DNA gyrase B-, and HSP90-like ATPase
MIDYSTQLAELKLVHELKESAGRADIPATEVEKLVALVNRVADIAGPLLELIPQTFKQYTDHNIRHSRNLISLMGRFIPSETLNQMNGLELSVLVLSALLHDFGMFVTEQEKRDALKSIEFESFLSGHHGRAVALEGARMEGDQERVEIIQDSLLAEFFRRLHPERARRNVRANLPNELVFGDVDISDYVLDVCESHGWGVYESNDPKYLDKSVSRLSTNKVVYGVALNLQYLACCLRLADIMDFDRSRTPLVVFQNIDFADKKSWDEWNKHLSVQGWVIDERDVLFRTECKHPAFYVAVMEFLDWVDRELTDCQRLITKEAPSGIADRYKLLLPPVVDRTQVEMEDKRYLAGAFRFQLEYESILKLLMDKSLYPDPSLFLRELLQNSLDACRNREARAKEVGQESLYDPCIVVWDYSSDAENPRVVFQDNGIGMSRQIVENYFMRVGRSYYRSPEFDSERARLKQTGIELEASSQFGIGILSCFMVADRLEIQTYRVGHKPLEITIEGPTKYFIIKLLDEPPRTDFPIRPTSHLDDGPPRFPGTRVTAYLRSDFKTDVIQTLDTFAANIDYNLTIYEHGRTEQIVVPRRRWEGEDVPFSSLEDSLEIGYQSVWPVAGLIPRKLPSKQSQVVDNLREILAYSPIPFEKYSFSEHLKGSAWFWLLRAEDGGVCPRRGDLSITCGLQLTGAPRLLQQITETIRVRYDSEEWRSFLHQLRSNARKMSLSVFASEPGADGFVNEKKFFDQWERLTAEERLVVFQSMESLNDDAEIWCEVQGLPSQLLLSNRKWSNHSIRFDCPLEIKTLPQSLALYGIRLPAGFIKWNAMMGESVNLKLLEFVPAAILADMRGASAPTPTASRLSVLYDEAKKSAIPLLRACLYHALELASSESDETGWREWLDAFLDSLQDLHFWPEIIDQEYHRLEAHLLYPVIIDRQVQYLHRKQVIEKFGRWVPFWDGRFSQEGVWAYRGGSKLLSAFKPRRRGNKNIQEADFEGKVIFEGDRLKDLILSLQQDVLYQ